MKIEITQDEPLLLPAPPRRVLHGYDEPLEAAVRAYGIEALLSP